MRFRSSIAFPAASRPTLCAAFRPLLTLVAGGHSCLRRLLWALLLGTLTAVVGCEGFDEEVEQVACDGLTLSVTAGEPLDSVALHGLPPEMGDTLVVAYSVEGDTLGGLLPVMSGTAPLFIVPAHPSGNLQGGSLQIRITDGVAVCPPQPFTVLALNPARGRFAQAVQALQQLIDRQAGLLGVSRAELQTLDPDTVLPPLIPLMLAQVTVDHPDNPNSLKRVAAGTAPAMEGAADFALLNALWAKTEVVGALAEQADSLAAGAPLAPVMRVRPGAGAGTDPQAWAQEPTIRFASFSLPPVRPPSPQSRAVAVPWPGRTPTAAELDKMMNLALHSEIRSTGKPKEIWDAMTITLAVGQAIPLPASQKAFAAAGKLAETSMTAMEAFSKLLPKRLVDLRIEVDQESFLEDEDARGRLTRAEVFARSEGWELGQKALEEVAKKLGGATAKKLTKNVDNSFTRDVFGITLTKLTQSALKPYIEKTGGNPGDIPPMLFGPTDISAPEWRDVRITGRAIQPVLNDTDSWEYEPIRAGTDELRISTPPMRFGLEQIRGKKVIRVHPIRVSVTPASVTARAGETVTLTAHVENAEDPGVAWSVRPEEVHTIISGGIHSHTAQVVLSDDPEHLPARIIARSTADRSHLLNAPPRLGYARIEGQWLRLRPENPCVLPDEEQAITVVRPNVDMGGVVFAGGAAEGAGDEFRWTTTAGFIDRTGVFRPPDGDGVATVRAVDRNDPSLEGSVEVRYGEQCRSHYQFEGVSGVSFEEEGGPVRGVSGIVVGGLCLTRVALNRSTQFPIAHLALTAALPEGLVPGRYPVTQGWSEETSVEGGLYRHTGRSSPWSLERGEPGAFVAFMQLKCCERSAFPERFLSESGQVDVERPDPEHLVMRFFLDMVEVRPREEQVAPFEVVFHPPRKIRVEGELNHPLTNINEILEDSYACQALEPD